MGPEVNGCFQGWRRGNLGVGGFRLRASTMGGGLGDCGSCSEFESRDWISTARRPEYYYLINFVWTQCLLLFELIYSQDSSQNWFQTILTTWQPDSVIHQMHIKTFKTQALHQWILVRVESYFTKSWTTIPLLAPLKQKSCRVDLCSVWKRTERTAGSAGMVMAFHKPLTLASRSRSILCSWTLQVNSILHYDLLKSDNVGLLDRFIVLMVASASSRTFFLYLCISILEVFTYLFMYIFTLWVIFFFTTVKNVHLTKNKWMNK